MSENYLMLNGKRIDLTQEQVKTLMLEEKKSPFARTSVGEVHFYINCNGRVYKDTEDMYKMDDEYFEVANYCTDKAMMEQRALHETLNRLLWRYSEEHGGDSEWDGYKYHSHILKSEIAKTFHTDTNANKKIQGVIYFKDKETAQAAIDEIVKPFIAKHPDFVW